MNLKTSLELELLIHCHASVSSKVTWEHLLYMCMKEDTCLVHLRSAVGERSSTLLHEDHVQSCIAVAVLCIDVYSIAYQPLNHVGVAFVRAGM